jgi:hypothetical protein
LYPLQPALVALPGSWTAMVLDQGKGPHRLSGGCDERDGVFYGYARREC